MKALLLAVSVAGLFLLSGCEDERHEHRGGAWEGGAYEGWNSGRGDREDHHWDQNRNWNYPNNPGPYQGYPNYNGYPNHY